MSVNSIFDPKFQAAVEPLRVPQMGTEVVATLLSSLVQMLRPRHVLEVGMGYTTPFLAAALSRIEEQVRAESAELAGKTEQHLATGATLDDAWLNTDPALLTPTYYLKPFNPKLVAVDNLSIADSSAVRVQQVLNDLGLDHVVEVVNADLRECVDKLPAGFSPIDLAWVDAWECLYFFDHFWDLINPDGGVVVFHYLMTYPEGEAVIRYITKFQEAHPGELEIMNLLEPHKLVQNSLTVLRRTGGSSKPMYAKPGGRLNYGSPLRDNALTHAAAQSGR